MSIDRRQFISMLGLAVASPALPVAAAPTAAEVFGKSPGLDALAKSMSEAGALEIFDLTKICNMALEKMK